MSENLGIVSQVLVGNFMVTVNRKIGLGIVTFGTLGLLVGNFASSMLVLSVAPPPEPLG